MQDNDRLHSNWLIDLIIFYKEFIFLLVFFFCLLFVFIFTFPPPTVAEMLLILPAGHDTIEPLIIAFGMWQRLAIFSK